MREINFRDSPYMQLSFLLIFSILENFGLRPDKFAEAQGKPGMDKAPSRALDLVSQLSFL
jgi:hypothetical protein